MQIYYRTRRAAKELLGLPQWPRIGPINPTNVEEQLYSALLKPGDVCFDVGANIGDVALFLARLTAPNGCIFAFEPVFGTYRKLCQQIQNDSYAKSPIITLPFGLSDAPGSNIISVPDGITGLASLGRPKAWNAIGIADIQTHICEFTTIDILLSNKGYPQPDFIKVDVEGAELLVLRGALGAFDRGLRPLMLLETFAPWQRAFNYGPSEFLDFLSQLDYQFVFVCPGGLVRYHPSPGNPFPPEFRSGYNLVAYQPVFHANRILELEPWLLGKKRILPMALPPCPNE